MKSKINLTDAYLIKNRGLVLGRKLLEGNFMNGEFINFILGEEDFTLNILSLEINRSINGDFCYVILVQTDETTQLKIRNHPSLSNTIAEIC